jgi:diaminopimelate decarboxylase
LITFLFLQFGNKYGNTYPILVRINPHIFAGGNYKISTGHIDSKFGISIHQASPHRKSDEEYQPECRRTSHAYGSEIKDPDVFLQALISCWSFLSISEPEISGYRKRIQNSLSGQ